MNMIEETKSVVKNELVTLMNGVQRYIRCEDTPTHTFYGSFPALGKHDGREVAEDFCARLKADGKKAFVFHNAFGWSVRVVKNDAIFQGINGYDLVKDVTKVTYGEYTPQTHLFVVERDRRLELSAIVEVAVNERGKCDELRGKWMDGKFDHDKYMIEFGWIWGDEIEYHWG